MKLPFANINTVLLELGFTRLDRTVNGAVVYLLDLNKNVGFIEVGKGWVSYQVKAEDFCVHQVGDYDYIFHKFLDVGSTQFQFNLQKYYLIHFGIRSSYEHVSDVVYGFRHSIANHTPAWFSKTNNGPSYDKWASKLSGFYPLYETCFTSANNACIINYLPDRVFFNYSNRHDAIERIACNDARNHFISIGYESMDDKQLRHYMNERFEARIRFEKMIMYEYSY